MKLERKRKEYLDAMVSKFDGLSVDEQDYIIDEMMKRRREKDFTTDNHEGICFVMKKTHNYKLFKKLTGKGNRKITKNKLRLIIESIKMYGYVPLPVIVNEKMEIIDGQHRAEACEILSLPIYYVIVPGLTVEEAMGMNQAQGAWNFIDFIYSQVDINVNYKNLVQLIENHKNLPLGTVLAATTQCYNNSSNGLTRTIIKNGFLEFPSRNYDDIDSKLKELETVTRLYKERAVGRTGRNDVFFSAMYYLMERSDFDNQIFINNLRRCTSITPNKSDFEECLKSLSKIYNKDCIKRFSYKKALKDFEKIKKSNIEFVNTCKGLNCSNKVTA